MTRFLGALTVCVRTGMKKVIACMDGNCRTGCRQAARWAPERISRDDSCDTRGREILSFLKAHDLAIMNGCQDWPRSGGFTSKQPRGSTVIDYFMVSRDVLPAMRSLSVGSLPNRFSDHAALTVEVVLPGTVGRVATLRDMAPLPPITPQVAPVPGQSKLDDLLESSLSSSLSSADSLRALYGASVLPEEDHVYVYSDGSCQSPGKSWAAAGSGVCWGLGSSRNSSHRVPGRQTSQRGELYATLQALVAADSLRCLCVRTDSEYVIHTLCHWAPALAEAGWACENADLIEACVERLAARPRITRFSWVKGHSGNALNEEADRLARVGCTLPMEEPPPRLSDVSPCLRLPLDPDVGGLPSKVCTDLPPCPLPSTKAVPTVEEILDDDVPTPATADPLLKGRAARRAQAAENLRKLEAVQKEASFWRLVYHVSHPRSRLAAVALDALRNVFMHRMNMPVVPPAEFAEEDLQRMRDLAAEIPECTIDATEGRHFSRRFTVKEVAALKAKIRTAALGSSRGIDNKSYKQLLDIPNDVLCELFNACLEVRNVPKMWLTTVLTAILKRKLDPSLAESYRTIGLECCLLKFLTMLFDGRIREWVAAADLLPKSQNGFRAGYRTNNNAFILRCAIDRARAQKNVLYLGSVDISNAFPSVNHAMLWRKLYDRGMSGPIFDVYRSVYSRMRYTVRVDGETSEEFAADMGILIGDPASPIMWLLYFADVEVPELLGDIVLAGQKVSHLEQADDIIIFATSPAALQAKLDAFYNWCCSVFLQVNKLKSWWMPLACRPLLVPTIWIGGEPVALREDAMYVGMNLCATTRNVFSTHSAAKAATSYGIASTIFSIIDKRCLQCPPSVSRKLYMALMDPHLTHGADVNPDAYTVSVKPLEKTQIAYLRRMLRVGKRSSLVALFTETAIWPIRYRRADLLVRYLGYLMQRPRGSLARAALDDSIALAAQGRPAWVSDVRRALAKLPIPVLLGDLSDSAQIEDARLTIKESMLTWLQSRLDANGKLELLQNRPDADWQSVHAPRRGPTMQFRAYLALKIPAHRTALTRLLLSEHDLAVERLRWENVDHRQRLCRLCRRGVEDPQHALFVCEGSPQLVELRTSFYRSVIALDNDLWLLLLQLDVTDMIRVLSVQEATLPSFARYVRDVLRLFGEFQMYRP